ncbi:unnamed protein product [Oreochromis niloticus]|nr:unnamed protein product [Mustela putorius furo]
MDDIQNFSALGARPRRNVRRPLRYEAYETDFPGLGAGYQEESETGGDTRSPHHPPSDTPDDRPHGHVTPLRAELADLPRERFLFQQSHDQMRAGLADFQAIHASLLQLLDRAESLQLSPPSRGPAVHLRPPPAEEKEDWPPPPPPVVFKEEPFSSQSPVTDRIDTMMKELQALKRESMTAQEGQIIPPPESRPRFTSPQPRPTHPPAPPPRAHPPPLQPLPAPTPSPSTPFSASQMHRPSGLAAAPDMTYRGPRPSIPKLTRRDPGEFARLKMALENLLPPESSELFRYQVLLDHLHLEEAKLIADAYLHSATPFSDTMNALNDRLGQPHQLALRRIAAVMDSPDIRRGDAAAFERFCLHIQSLVGMLKTLGPDGEVELQCGSHVARLLSKLPSEQRADFRRCMYNHSGQAYTLDDLATWLKYESWCQGYDGLPTPMITREKPDVRPSRRPVTVLHGAETSPRSLAVYKVRNAFTATRIDLAEHSYPVESLQRKYRHLRGLPLQSFKKVKPLLLIGSDHPQLITPTEAVRLGPPGGPAAMRTRLGWTLQGPSSLIGSSSRPQQCLFTTAVPPQVTELLKHVEKLWQVDVVPVPEGKVVTRSREDNYAVSLLEQKTVRVEVEGIRRYATPLLRRQNMPCLKASPNAVIPSLRSVERRLQKDPGRAKIYRAEIEKLVQAGSVVKVSPSEVAQADESWYIPHHFVSHNGKDRLVFNCSFQFQGQALNEHLLPGPTLSASLLGVLLRFREHAVAISGDIKGMFHQIRLLPEDRSLLRFVWRDLHPEAPVAVYEWQVLPFGTTCSPCCATFALQRHTRDHTEGDDPLRHSVGRCFYVDNLLQSVPTPEGARDLVDGLRALLSSAGFVLRQWASNEPSTIGHLPEDLRSTSAELWLTQDKSDTSEPTLGLSWHFPTDTLGYKHRKVSYGAPTMRNIYKVLASQYDPLGFILPYTTRAKMLVRRLWDQQRGWDDPQLPPELLQQWETWEEELPFLAQILLPRPYLPKHITESVSEREIHIFCDASEQAYGAVAYMRTVTGDGSSHLAFLMARSRVAPKRILSMPRLELCGALSGAHLSRLLRNELTLDIKRIVLWSDSTTVLTWLRSESCHFKVFVGTRVAEIQEVTQSHTWRYVDSAQNPADDITRGKTLTELARPNRWSQGPPFLLLSPEQWPPEPSGTLAEPPGPSELRKETFCGVSTTFDPATSNFSGYDTWAQLLEAAITQLHGAAKGGGTSSAQDYIQAEMHVLREAQQESFPEEYRLLKQGNSISRSSRLLALSPEFDREDEVIRVGGRLRHSEDLAFSNSHPLVLDPTHPVTRLLIQDVDSRLRHPGPERVFAEIRRTHWILRGREAVRSFQRTCLECRRWKARPTVPKMADLPVVRLRLYKPAFYSTAVDCFGPFEVKIGRRVEKRGGERELQAAFAAMTSDLQKLLAPQKIVFHFNPPAAPHFGGVWEREIRSVKTALYTTVGSQPLQEEVLRMVLVEVEGILNSKPLGYVSSDISDPDPVTPNCFLMGRPDGVLPQLAYPKEELLSRRRWKHSQVLADHFWSRFIRLYLPSLQLRPKWQSSPADVTEGSVVMIVDPQLPRASWLVGCISKVHPSPDGHIRSADVKVKDRTFT